MATAREARNKYNREWYAKNKDRLSEYRRKWREDHPDKAAAANERTKKWQRENPDRVKENQRRYWERKAATMGVEE